MQPTIELFANSIPALWVARMVMKGVSEVRARKSSTGWDRAKRSMSALAGCQVLSSLVATWWTARLGFGRWVFAIACTYFESWVNAAVARLRTSKLLSDRAPTRAGIAGVALAPRA